MNERQSIWEGGHDSLTQHTLWMQEVRFVTPPVKWFQGAGLGKDISLPETLASHCQSRQMVLLCVIECGSGFRCSIIPLPYLDNSMLSWQSWGTFWFIDNSSKWIFIPKEGYLSHTHTQIGKWWWVSSLSYRIFSRLCLKMDNWSIPYQLQKWGNNGYLSTFL